MIALHPAGMGLANAAKTPPPAKMIVSVATVIAIQTRIPVPALRIAVRAAAMALAIYSKTPASVPMIAHRFAIMGLANATKTRPPVPRIATVGMGRSREARDATMATRIRATAATKTASRSLRPTMIAAVHY
jgi:hypothetical protein